jgi:hypothetical protein
MDYTGLIYFRHPVEVGGLFWSLNPLIALLCSCASVAIYYGSTSRFGGDDADYFEVSRNATNNTTLVADSAEFMSESNCWKLVGGLSGSWVLVFLLMISIMKKKYRKTFFLTKTGKQVTMELMSSPDEEVKASIFKRNRGQWKAVEGDVEIWVKQNWFRWKKERPKWFTENLIAKIPDFMIPKEEDRVVLGEMRRRSSLGALVLGGNGGLLASVGSSATVVPSNGGTEVADGACGADRANDRRRGSILDVGENSDESYGGESYSDEESDDGD